MLKYKIKVVDNFFSSNDFKQLCTIAKKLPIKNNFNVYHNEIDRNNNILVSSLDKNFLKKINRTYLPIALKILNALNPLKVNLYNYSDFTIIKIKKNAKFPIHDDTPNKLLSGVVYLYPRNNLGTFFYKNKKGHNEREIKWKQNRSVFFSRKERVTWHSYKSDGINDRTVLVYNLMTNEKNIKSVCKIENKNYFLCNLRYKINPYIFRYFNKTI